MAWFGMLRGTKEDKGAPKGSMQIYEDARKVYANQPLDRSANGDRIARLRSVIEAMDRETHAWHEGRNVNEFNFSILKSAYLLMRNESVPTQWQPTAFDLYYLLNGLYQKWNGADPSAILNTGSRANDIVYLFTGAVTSDEWTRCFVDMFQQLSRHNRAQTRDGMSLMAALRKLCESQGLTSRDHHADGVTTRVSRAGHDDESTVRLMDDRMGTCTPGDAPTVRVAEEPKSVPLRKPRRRDASAQPTVEPQNARTLVEQWNVTQTEWQTTMRQMQGSARDLVKSMRDFQDHYIVEESIAHARQLIEIYTLLDGQYEYQRKALAGKNGNGVPSPDGDYLKVVEALRVIRNTVQRQLNVCGVTVVRSRPGTSYDPELHEINGVVGGTVETMNPDTATVSMSVAPGFHSDQFAQLNRKEFVVLAVER